MKKCRTSGNGRGPTRLPLRTVNFDLNVKVRCCRQIYAGIVHSETTILDANVTGPIDLF